MQKGHLFSVNKLKPRFYTAFAYRNGSIKDAGVKLVAFTSIYLSGYHPYFRGLDNLCAQKETVVLVVVGDDDAALLLFG